MLIKKRGFKRANWSLETLKNMVQFLIMNSDQDISFKDLFVPITSKKAIIIIAFVGLIVYFNMLFNGFVWDDLTYIINNPEIRNFNIISLFGQNSFNSSGYFRPIPAVYFSALYNLFGNSAFFYHFFQLSLHIIDTTLLFYIFRYFFKEKIALFLSLLFLIHPINVESVAYIGASQSELLLLFGGLAFYLSLKEKLKLMDVFLVNLLLVCAILTKEVSVLFFIVIYGYRLLFKMKLQKIFYFATGFVIAAYLVIRFSSLGTFIEKMNLIPISRISFGERLINIPEIIFYYIRTFIFPARLAIDQIWTVKNITINSFYFPLFMDIICIGSLAFFLWYLFKKRNKSWKIFAFFFAWSMLGICMLLQIFPLDMTVADRWFYFPFVGLLGMLGVCSKYFGRYLDKYKSYILAFALLLFLILSIRTIVRNSDWHTPLSLYTHDLQGYDNYDIENFLAAELVMLNRYDEALPHLKRAVKLLPHDTNLYNLGSVYEHFNKYDDAKRYYNLALHDTNFYSIHSDVRKFASEGLCRMTLLNGKSTDAKEEATKALLEFPEDGTLWGYLAIAEYNLENQKEAEKAAQNARKFLPNATTGLLLSKIKNHQPLNLKFK